MRLGVVNFCLVFFFTIFFPTGGANVEKIFSGRVLGCSLQYMGADTEDDCAGKRRVTDADNVSMKSFLWTGF